MVDDCLEMHVGVLSGDRSPDCGSNELVIHVQLKGNREHVDFYDDRSYSTRKRCRIPDLPCDPSISRRTSLTHRVSVLPLFAITIGKDGQQPDFIKMVEMKTLLTTRG